MNCWVGFSYLYVVFLGIKVMRNLLVMTLSLEYLSYVAFHSFDPSVAIEVVANIGSPFSRTSRSPNLPQLNFDEKTYTTPREQHSKEKPSNSTATDIPSIGYMATSSPPPSQHSSKKQMPSGFPYQQDYSMRLRKADLYTYLSLHRSKKQISIPAQHSPPSSYLSSYM